MTNAFEDTSLAFHDKSKRELLRAFWLFRLVGSPFLVRVGAAKLRFALWIRFPVRWILKPTIFSHFCGGEDIDECQNTIDRLGASGIMTILDYSAEGKESEADFDRTTNQVMATIRKAAGEENIPYAVFKPTGLVRFGLLEKIQAGDSLSEAEKAEFDRFKERMDNICKLAEETGIPVMIDAEESWIQDVVDQLVEKLIFTYNKKKPLVFATLQMYRHDRLHYLKNFSERAREKGVFAAFKLVRGAYMEKERKRALDLGYPSPIYPDKPSTDQAFDQAVAFCLGNLDHLAVCVGTHNENSCEAALEVMSNLDILAGHERVSFAQLLGMSDHISYPLAASAYNVCKYVPYGPVNTVVPYLIRRAEENTSVAGQTSRELFLIKKEIKRRKDP
ncbi:MAG: proline dehydrogenase family protein [Bacteroidales bacterium]